MVRATPTLDILVATYAGNLPDIQANLPRILDYCVRHLPDTKWRVTVAFNGNPALLPQAKALVEKMDHVRLTHVSRPGKGSAVLNGIRASPADYIAYMDADLATSLDDFRLLYDSALTHGFASGSRYNPHSHITRDFIRFGVSRVYTGFILKWFLGAQFVDPQCGFKAMKRAQIEPILGMVEDSWFFFETELTYRAQQQGLRVAEVPVTWVERANSSVKLVPTVINFIRNLFRIRFSPGRVADQAWMEPVRVIVEAPFARVKKKTQLPSASR